MKTINNFLEKVDHLQFCKTKDLGSKLNVRSERRFILAADQVSGTLNSCPDSITKLQMAN